MKLTYLLFSVYLSVLCNLGSFEAILSDLSSVRFPYWGVLTVFLACLSQSVKDQVIFRLMQV